MEGYENMLLRNFKLYFPLDANHIVYWEPIGYGCLEIKLDTDEVLIYEDPFHAVRKLPADSDEMTEEQFRIEFGRRLRRIMEHKGITQVELHDITGIPQCHISGYINGRHTPSFYAIHKIANALRCSIDDLRYK